MNKRFPKYCLLKLNICDVDRFFSKSLSVTFQKICIIFFDDFLFLYNLIATINILRD